MLRISASYSLLLLSGLACFGGQVSQAPQPARPAYDPAAPPPAPPPQKIYVDERCRILPDPDVQTAGKPKPHKDHIICHLEGQTTSVHVEEAIRGTTKTKHFVTVDEQTFVLQNVYSDPVVFVVTYAVPKDWTVDSDPQPAAMAGSTAIFPTHADPGQIVRLHVGMRHVVGAKPPAQPAPQTPATGPNTP